MSRVLETVLTGRNLLSPVLATAARDVAAYSTTVTETTAKVSTAAATSARAQQTASTQVVASNSRVATSATTTATTQTRAHTQVITSAQAMAAAQGAASQAVISANARLAGAVNGSTATYQRSASSLREKLGLQALEGSAAERSAASNSRAAASAAVFTTAIDRNSTALARETAASAVDTRTTQANTTAREQAAVATRLQASATSALASSNGLLGGSLTPLTAGVGAVGLGLAYAGYRGMEFGTAMSQVQAASQATAGDLDRLRDAAIDQGAKTQYSAEEAAQGITEMAKAGVSTADVLNGGLAGALNLAAAGQMEVADAAEVGATALSVFRLEGSQMGHVADLLAAGAGKAQGSVYDLSAALNQSALVASQTGLSIEDTAGALAMFASNGLTGSDAGTSFKTMLQALTPNSEASARAMSELGISAYDAQGNFVGLEAFAEQLQGALGGLTEEQRNATLETIFGSDAVRAASVLYREGAAGVGEWAAKVDDAGFAAEQAATLNDNLRGDLEKLGGAFDSAMTSIGDGTQGALREVVQMLTTVVEAGGDVIGFFANLPGPVQIALTSLGAVALLKGPVVDSVKGIGFALDVFRASAANAGGAAGILKSGASGLLGVFGGPWGLAITGAVTGLSLLTSWLGDSDDAASNAAASQTNLAQALEATGGAIDRTVRAAAAKDLVGAGLNKWADDLGVNVTEMTDALLGVPGAAEKIGSTFQQLLEGEYTEIIDANGQVTGAYTEQGEKILAARDRWLELAGITETTVSSQKAVAEAAAETGTAVEGSVVQTEAAAAAQEKWLETVSNSLAGFVDPLGAYQALLDEKTTSEREAAEKTAASTEDSSDSWKDYVTEVDVSLDELATRLEEQLLAQDNWRANIATVTRRGGVEVGQILLAMGEEGVQIAADMATGTDAQFQHMAGLLVEQSHRAGSGAAAAFDQELKVMAEIGAAGAGATARQVADKLNLGLGEVAEIAARYGVVLADGVNPVLTALGKASISIGHRSAQQAAGRGLYAADGAIFGDGREDHVAQIARPGDWRVWAEPETGGEAYIPLSPAKRARSMDIWRETGRRLDAPEAQYFAAGGFASAGDVPRPPSTAPYGPPVSTAGDATMQKGFDEVRAWLEANVASGPIGSGAAGGSWQALWAQVHAQFPTARKTSDYRPGDPGYHGRGKAVDVAGARPGDAAAMLAINRWAAATMGANLAELIYTPGINLYQGKPHTYGAATRADHNDHVHLAARERGGPVWPGQNFLVGENGPEIARFTAPATVYPNGTGPAAMPGYGMAGGLGQGGGPLVVQSGPVHVYLDGQEWRGMARVEAQTVVVEADSLQKRNDRRWTS